MAGKYKISNGNQHPLGATPDDKGTNFSLYSENAEGVELLIFDEHDDLIPIQTIRFDPKNNRTFHFWHVYVEGLKPGTHYNLRVYGPNEPYKGHRFNPNKVLLDPYCKGMTDSVFDRGAATQNHDNTSKALRSVIIDLRGYDWEGDTPINTPLKDSIIYEMHVGGFTRNPNSKVDNPGTFKAVIEKIPYLKELGVTAVELLPVFAFDDKTEIGRTPDGKPLYNYWGYSTISFFAPHASYCINPETGNHINEFRDMVKALHKAGIEVILDVVFNHTDEGNHQGPYFNFKGIDNSVYYFLVPGNNEYYFDYSGCGNTVKANHPAIEKFIFDCLRFWVEEMHVDGFRFDEGSILSRGEDGKPLEHPPLIWNLELDETFDNTKLIAEAWDAAGLYQIGSFPGYRWSEWNGKYRDTLRKYLKGDSGIISQVATRIAGSADLYQHTRHKPTNSINFINCHDGFTMRDLVSYNCKHNEANGENNNDGVDDNMSWNSGLEGGSDDLNLEAFRKQRIKNFAALLMLSKGVPMLLSGDEVGKSQNGNNNVYCQNNETAWFDWNQTEINSDLFRFWKYMIEFRKSNPALMSEDFFSGQINSFGLKDIEWHGVELNKPGWNDPQGKALAFTIASFTTNKPNIHVMVNMHYEELEFEIPFLNGLTWFRFVDTSKKSPDDIVPAGIKINQDSKKYKVNPYTVIILISK
ncbi:MAG: glycogen debranching protein GlgX [Candidatus Kapabacteria bacterium]|nr:glycogen debranching protein GlgX [Ignavibacteriota bacterium]MCW5885283.1 glycogen debranching protein GlgX [Candidatus Kapabacteria bacterium]